MITLIEKMYKLEDDIKALNSLFTDHKERFVPQSLAVIQARTERASVYKNILSNNELLGWSGLILKAPMQTYIKEIENIYQLQALFATKENLEKIKAGCSALGKMHDELNAIPPEAHDEASAVYTQAFLTQVTIAIQWGDSFFKQIEAISEARAKLITKNIEYQSVKTENEARNSNNQSFFFANPFYNPAFYAPALA